MKKNFFVYILRLLAGKLGPVCIEFPLTTISAKILIGSNSKFSTRFSMNNTSCNFFLFLTIFRFALVSFDRNLKLVLLFFLARDVVNITFTIISNMASYTQSASQKNFISKPKQSITLTFFFCISYAFLIHPFCM